jgi:hypothetical protein
MRKSMFWLALLIGCARIEAPVASVPTAPASRAFGWQAFESTEGKFSVLFPAAPRKTVTAAPEHRPATAFICDMPGNRTFIVTFEDPAGFAEKLAKAPATARAKMIEAGLDNGLDETLKAAKQVLSREKIALGSHPGREIEVELPDGTFLRQRIYSVAGRIYTVTVGGPKESLRSDDAQKFFGSFKLITTP